MNVIQRSTNRATVDIGGKKFKIEFSVEVIELDIRVCAMLVGVW